MYTTGRAAMYKHRERTLCLQRERARNRHRERARYMYMERARTRPLSCSTLAKAAMDSGPSPPRARPETKRYTDTKIYGDKGTQRYTETKRYTDTRSH